MNTAETISDAWVNPHDVWVSRHVETYGVAEHWASVAEYEASPHGLAEWLLPEEGLVGVVGNVVLARVNGQVVRFPDGSALTFHAWADGNASGWWWTGDGPAPTNVARGVAVDADARLAEAAAEVADAFAALAAGRNDGRTADAIAAYRAAVTDVSHPGDPNYGDGDADPLRWVTYVAEAAAEGVRDEVTRKAYA